MAYTATNIENWVDTDPPEGCNPSDINDAIREVKDCVENTFGVEHSNDEGMHEFNTVSKTTTYTATTLDTFIKGDTSGGAWTLTLFAASGNTGAILMIKKTTSDSNALTIDGNAAETIDGATTQALSNQYDYMILICDGSNWHILATNKLDGWHGSATRIKILPRDFLSNDDAEDGLHYVDNSNTYGVRVQTGNSEMFAFVPIPTGYKATALMVYDNSVNRAVTVYEGNINSTSLTSKGTGNANTEIDITDVTSSTTNYLVILVAVAATTDLVTGGYVTIAKV